MTGEATPITSELLGQLLAELDDELAGHGRSSLLLVGGAAVMQLVPERSSFDVDVAQPELDDATREAARRVGEQYGLEPDWLNDAFRQSFPMVAATVAKEHGTVVFEGRNLRVRIPSVPQLMWLKIKAGRGQDIDDLIQLMALEASDRTVDGWLAHFEALFGDRLTQVERSRVREAALEVGRRAAERNDPSQQRSGLGG